MERSSQEINVEYNWENVLLAATLRRHAHLALGQWGDVSWRRFLYRLLCILYGIFQASFSVLYIMWMCIYYVHMHICMCLKYRVCNVYLRLNSVTFIMNVNERRHGDISLKRRQARKNWLAWVSFEKRKGEKMLFFPSFPFSSSLFSSVPFFSSIATVLNSQILESCDAIMCKVTFHIFLL